MVPAQFASKTLIKVYVVVTLGVTDIEIEFAGEFPGNVVTPSEYWNVHGPVPVKSNIKSVLCPLHTEGLPVTEAVGKAFTVSVTVVGALAQPVIVSVTNTVVTFTDALLKPSCKLVGAEPIAKTVVSAASPYQV